MDKTVLIKSYQKFYHITEDENVKSILKKGLKLNKYKDFEYHDDCPEKKAQICLTTRNKLKEQFSSRQQNHPETKFVVFEISADYIITTNYGLDWTMEFTNQIAGDN